MEAKDTVIRQEQRILKDYPDIDAAMLDQAITTWKLAFTAGKREGATEERAKMNQYFADKMEQLRQDYDRNRLAED